MKVRVSSQAAQIAEDRNLPVEAEIRDGATRRNGDQILIDPGQWSSCSRWGRRDADAYVVGFMAKRADGKMVFKAEQRRPDSDVDAYRIPSAHRAKKHD